MRCTTFACVFAQTSGADPTAPVCHIGRHLTVLLLDDGQLISEAKPLCDGGRFRHPPSRNRQQFSSGDGNVARSQTRSCQTLCLSVQLKHGGVVSVSHVACVIFVDVSLEYIEYLKELDGAASQNETLQSLTLSGSISSSL